MEFKGTKGRWDVCKYGTGHVQTFTEINKKRDIGIEDYMCSKSNV